MASRKKGVVAVREGRGGNGRFKKSSKKTYRFFFCDTGFTAPGKVPKLPDGSLFDGCHGPNTRARDLKRKKRKPGKKGRR